MRLIVAGLTAVLLMLPAAPPSVAAAGVHKAQPSDFSAAKKKKKGKKSRAKVEYMRAVPAK